MKAVIVTNSSSYEPRAEKVGCFLQKQGFGVMWIQSDFNHREKKKMRRDIENHRFINTVPYKKNMSIRRMYSQYDFSRKVYRLLKDEPVDLLYVLIPANSLTPVAARLKKRAEARLVLDLIDLWPESLPIKGLEWFWPVRCWRKLRDDYLAAADLVLTECGLYQQLLRMDGNPDIKRKSVMYWPKEREPEREPGFLPDSDRLHIGYIGSINHIIDMDLILEVLDKVNQKKPVVVHVIGDGENRETFLEKLKSRGLEAEYYGAVYDEEAKRRILEKCGFGINMMKETVQVGLTMKSIDYFCCGVPLINNIKGDTWEMVERYGIGVNCRRENPEECAGKILEVSERIQERRGLIRELYGQLFTEQAMEQVLERELLPLFVDGAGDYRSSQAKER